MGSARNYWVLTALFGLGLSASAQAAKPDPVRGAIEKQNAAFSAAFARGDIAAMAAAYTEDAIAFPPDADMARGRAAIQALWQGLRDADGKSIALTTVDVHSSGGLAAETGTAVTKMQPPAARSSPGPSSTWSSGSARPMEAGSSSETSGTACGPRSELLLGGHQVHRM